MTDLRPAHGGNLRWAAAQAGCSPDAILDFSANINPLGPPTWLAEALLAALPTLRHYPDPEYRELRQALGDVHHVPPTWIWPGNGAAELLTWIARDLATLKSVTVVTPAFGDYRRALQAAGAHLRPWPLPWPSLADPLAELPAGRQSGLLITNPHSPTGCLFCRQSLTQLLEHWALVVVDEAFMDFLPPTQDQSLIPWVRDYPNLIVLRSLTKFYSLPGLRLGYAVGHPERWQRYQDWRDPWPVNALAAGLVPRLLADQAFQQQTWDWLTTARADLLAALAVRPDWHPHPSVTNFLLVKTGRPAPDLQRQLLVQARILVRDTLSYPELGDHYLRLAVRTSPDHEHLRCALLGLPD
ncbi:MAG: threonine-phosphate decarboxylase [Gloeomargaritaceae cyanobacterium C42_A2020_066]|nr:threonine-phosphate decarboxylase [Gloeomargaritaceae cyanobacterium C42_A2020_066]